MVRAGRRGGIAGCGGASTRPRTCPRPCSVSARSGSWSRVRRSVEQELTLLTRCSPVRKPVLLIHHVPVRLDVRVDTVRHLLDMRVCRARRCRLASCSSASMRPVPRGHPAKSISAAGSRPAGMRTRHCPLVLPVDRAARVAADDHLVRADRRVGAGVYQGAAAIVGGGTLA